MDIYLKCPKRHGGEMMNVNLLKSKIVLKGKKIPSIANDLGISRTSLYRKLNGKSEFTRSEIARLIGILDLKKENAIEIFFDDLVS